MEEEIFKQIICAVLCLAMRLGFNVGKIERLHSSEKSIVSHCFLEKILRIESAMTDAVCCAGLRG